MHTQFNSFFVGIDVAKDALDVCLLGPTPPRHWRVRQHPDALAELARELVALAPARIVVEHSGGYQTALVDALAGAELPVVVMNPKRIRDFAKSEGVLAKTDRLDAAVLALFAAKIQPPLRALPAAEQRELAELTSYQQKLVADRAALKVQLQRAEQGIIQASLLRRLEQLDEERRQLEAEIDARIAASPACSERALLARSAPGVGVQVARTIVAQLPELGGLSERAIAALVGLAPFADESGRYQGRRRIRGGRKRVRRMFYLAALTAVRVDLRSGEFYRGLVSRGKPKKLALIAVARKLLVALNHMFATRTPWDSRSAA